METPQKACRRFAERASASIVKRLERLGGLASLTLAIALYLLLEGVLELALSFQLRPAPGSGWQLFDGIFTLVLAVMIWSTWPSSAVWVVGTLVGISMFFSGTTPADALDGRASER